MASEDEVAATVEDARHGAARDVDATGLPRGTTIDRYVVIDKVGQGGMGVVYSAYDHVLDRRVAVKLVVSRGGADNAALLLAEARAMAQLSHPAIVPVHDIGAFRGRVFLAMAFVDGTTLRAWQTTAARPWREVVDMYRRIGDGLAVAHDEGIIHRDFKPDNVLVDEDGRPHITDFGLAKIVLASESASPAPNGRDTITGRVAGTPGYMSPQQARGEPTDARTDQYAFCASLFEALHGARQSDEPPPRADVPRRIIAAIARGLEDDPVARWPSMRELVAALAPPAPIGRRVTIIAASALVPAALVMGLAVHRAAPRASCELTQASAAWQGKRSDVQAALAKSEAGAELVVALDRWTTSWTDMAQASCRATADGAQSTQLLDLRERCLGHALDVTSSLVDLASRADPNIVRRASSVAANLPSLAPCADAAGLLGAPPLPANGAQRALITALERALARVEALVSGESFRAAAELLDALVPSIDAVDYAPLRFELYDTRSSVEIARQSDPDAAADAAWAAIAADPTRSDARAAGVWIDLMWIVGVMQHAPAQAIEIAKIAEAIEARVQDKHQTSLLDHRLATILVDAGKLDEAIARFERAIAGFAAEGDLHEEAVSVGGEANAYSAKGDAAKQLELLERAVALASKLPHSHLMLANQLDELGIAYMEAKRFDDATSTLGRALAAMGDGSDDPALLAAIHGNLGNVAERQGNLAAAEREYRTELDLARAKLGADVSDVEIAWYNLGQIEYKRGGLADAIASLHQSTDILNRSPHEAAESGDYAGPGELAHALVTAELAAGHASGALADAEACLAIAQRDAVHSGTLADVHYALAQAAWAAGDRARARSVMTVAAAEYRAAHAPSDDADGWLASH